MKVPAHVFGIHVIAWLFIVLFVGLALFYEGEHDIWMARMSVTGVAILAISGIVAGYYYRRR